MAKKAKRRGRGRPPKPRRKVEGKKRPRGRPPRGPTEQFHCRIKPGSARRFRRWAEAEGLSLRDALERLFDGLRA